MTKLDTKTAQAIANLIDSIETNNIMREMARERQEYGSESFWLAQEFKDIIRLKEEYGIPHTNYDWAVTCMAKEIFANAKLTKRFKVANK